MRKRAKWKVSLTYPIIVLVLVLAGNALAINWDDGADPNERWSAAANWAGNVVPGIADTAVINMADVNCLIDSTVDACCSTLTVGLDTGPSYLTMTGGSLTTNGNLTVGDDPDANGIFIISDGNISIPTGSRLWIGLGSDSTPTPAYGYFLMKGGQFTGGTKFYLGKNTYGVGTLEIQGGSMDFTGGSSDFEFGTRGNATVKISDGNLTFLDKFRMSDDNSDTGVASVQMDGGNITCNDLWMNNGTPTIYIDGGVFTCTDQIEMGSDNALIDITEGEFIAETLGEETDIRNYMGDDKIIGYGGAGYVILEIYGGSIHLTASLYDPDLAWDPKPKGTVEWTPAGPTLSWQPGRYADKHDVYFGTDEDDVNNATDPCTPPGRGRQDPNFISFPTPPPVLGQTYYWRIDEVNDANIWKGLIWQFTMADYEEAEGFDSYANEGALEDVWTLTGSDIDIEDTIVRSGKSMRYYYTTGSATEAYANTTGANKLPVDINDWTTADIKALTLYFYGKGDNVAEKMYVALEDTDSNLAVVYYDNPNDINEPEWHEWNIKLSDFNTPNDVNLHRVDKVYIGFGSRGSPPTNSGTVYFDDIRLYPTRCVAAYAPEGDADNDCDVDFYDVDAMAGEWLEMDYNGVGYDGVLGVNFPGDNSQWTTGKYDNGLQFDGVDDWVDLDDSDFSDFRNKTIAFWVKIRDYPSVYRYLFYFSDGDADNPYRIYFMTRTENVIRVRFVEDYSADVAAPTNWFHLAFVLEDAAAGRCTGTLYKNGSWEDTLSGRPRHSGAAVGVNIGSSNDGSGGFVDAVFDDFRVYDYNLSPDEISYLAGAGGTEPNNNLMLLYYDFNETEGFVAHNSSTYEFYHPLLSDAELYEGEAEGSRVVNFRDLAVLANTWLKEQLWP